MKTVNVHAAKTHLSALLDEAAAGEEIIIAKAGKPVARLTALPPSKMGLVLGSMHGKIQMRDDFDDPLPADILKGFGIES